MQSPTNDDGHHLCTLDAYLRASLPPEAQPQTLCDKIMTMVVCSGQALV